MSVKVRVKFIQWGKVIQHYANDPPEHERIEVEKFILLSRVPCVGEAISISDDETLTVKTVIHHQSGNQDGVEATIRAGGGYS